MQAGMIRRLLRFGAVAAAVALAGCGAAKSEGVAVAPVEGAEAGFLIAPSGFSIEREDVPRQPAPDRPKGMSEEEFMHMVANQSSYTVVPDGRGGVLGYLDDADPVTPSSVLAMPIFDDHEFGPDAAVVGFVYGFLSEVLRVEELPITPNRRESLGSFRQRLAGEARASGEVPTVVGDCSEMLEEALSGARSMERQPAGRMCVTQ